MTPSELVAILGEALRRVRNAYPERPAGWAVIELDKALPLGTLTPDAIAAAVASIIGAR